MRLFGQARLAMTRRQVTRGEPEETGRLAASAATGVRLGVTRTDSARENAATVGCPGRDPIRLGGTRRARRLGRDRTGSARGDAAAVTRGEPEEAGRLATARLSQNTRGGARGYLDGLSSRERGNGWMPGAKPEATGRHATSAATRARPDGLGSR